MTQIKVNAIIKNNGKILVAKRCSRDGGFWQTITGTVENNENIIDTLKREIKEEAGISKIKIDKTPVHYFIWQKGKDDVVEIVYLVSTKEANVKLSQEHDAYLWLEPKAAIKKVGKANNKMAIRKAMMI
ncbi:MAG: hypothetical protein UV36_C0004G0020 [Parcubacteria group bacterium GW2011_GWC2_42_6]|nr:MAG: hypothetical protein UU87_C0003G0123 [Parcubacteria group bacterium GW2011_GWA2_42_11]KKS67695.1 MAG: hypothetical protein UV36_C0004G0020 [Parcubacteria group bacterium GW2011_GWC2_42_6]KKT76451.1 MAG: hypothetical protein UW72_C0005G0019 [Parcubacteria group bacterium GW2011_GWF2_44_7]